MPAESGGRFQRFWSLLTSCCGRRGSYSFNTRNRPSRFKALKRRLTHRSLKRRLRRRRLSANDHYEDLILPPRSNDALPVLNIGLGFDENDLTHSYRLLKRIGQQKKKNKLLELSQNGESSAFYENDIIVDDLPSTVWLECVEPTLEILISLNKLRHRRSNLSRKRPARPRPPNNGLTGFDNGDSEHWTRIFIGPPNLLDHNRAMLLPTEEIVPLGFRYNRRFVVENGEFHIVLRELPPIQADEPTQRASNRYRNRRRSNIDPWTLIFERDFLTNVLHPSSTDIPLIDDNTSGENNPPKSEESSSTRQDGESNVLCSYVGNSSNSEESSATRQEDQCSYGGNSSNFDGSSLSHQDGGSILFHLVDYASSDEEYYETSSLEASADVSSQFHQSPSSSGSRAVYRRRNESTSAADDSVESENTTDSNGCDKKVCDIPSSSDSDHVICENRRKNSSDKDASSTQGLKSPANLDHSYTRSGSSNGPRDIQNPTSSTIQDIPMFEPIIDFSLTEINVAPGNCNQSATSDDDDDSSDEYDTDSFDSSSDEEEIEKEKPDTWFWIPTLHHYIPRKGRIVFGPDMNKFKHNMRAYVRKVCSKKKKQLDNEEALEVNKLLRKAPLSRFFFLKYMSVYLEHMDEYHDPQPLSKVEEAFYGDLPNKYQMKLDEESGDDSPKWNQSRIKKSSKPLGSKVQKPRKPSNRPQPRSKIPTRDTIFATKATKNVKVNDNLWESDSVSSFSLSHVFDDSMESDSDSELSEGYVICNIISDTSCKSVKCGSSNDEPNPCTPRTIHKANVRRIMVAPADKANTGPFYTMSTTDVSPRSSTQSLYCKLNQSEPNTYRDRDSKTPLENRYPDVQAISNKMGSKSTKQSLVNKTEGSIEDNVNNGSVMATGSSVDIGATSGDSIEKQRDSELNKTIQNHILNTGLFERKGKFRNAIARLKSRFVK